MWMLAYHSVVADKGTVDGPDDPTADALVRRLLTADKVLVNDDYLNRMTLQAEHYEKYAPYMRLNPVVDGTWFEIVAPMWPHNPYRLGFMTYAVQEYQCKMLIATADPLDGDRQDFNLWTNNGVYIQPDHDGNPSFAFAVNKRMLPEHVVRDLIVMGNIIGAMSLFDHKVNKERKLSRGMLREHGMGHYKATRVRYISLTDPRPLPVPLGGTHASPALHTVKGHWRWKGTAKERWIEAFKRGNPAYGEIVHEYGTGKKIRVPAQELTDAR